MRSFGPSNFFAGPTESRTMPVSPKRPVVEIPSCRKVPRTDARLPRTYHTREGLASARVVQVAVRQGGARRRQGGRSRTTNSKVPQRTPAGKLFVLQRTAFPCAITRRTRTPGAVLTTKRVTVDGVVYEGARIFCNVSARCVNANLTGSWTKLFCWATRAEQVVAKGRIARLGQSVVVHCVTADDATELLDTVSSVLVDCAICCDEVAIDRCSVATGCNHCFCTPCIRRWAQTSSVCPICRCEMVALADACSSSKPACLVEPKRMKEHREEQSSESSDSESDSEESDESTEDTRDPSGESSSDSDSS